MDISDWIVEKLIEILIDLMRGFISQMNGVVIDWLIDWLLIDWPGNEEDQQSRHSSMAADHDNQSTLWVQVQKVIIIK